MDEIFPYFYIYSFFSTLTMKSGSFTSSRHEARVDVVAVAVVAVHLVYILRDFYSKTPRRMNLLGASYVGYSGQSSERWRKEREREG